MDKPITAAIPDGKGINTTKARLKIVDIEVTEPIGKDVTAMTFRARPRASKTRLQSWFADNRGESGGIMFI